MRRPTVDVPSAAFLHERLGEAKSEIFRLRGEVEAWKCRAQRAEDQCGRNIAAAAGAQCAAAAAERKAAELDARCKKLQDTLVERIETDAAHLSELRNEIGLQTKRADAAEAELADIRGSTPL
jgi:chromosome segregation ATPase